VASGKHTIDTDPDSDADPEVSTEALSTGSVVPRFPAATHFCCINAYSCWPGVSPGVAVQFEAFRGPSRDCLRTIKTHQPNRTSWPRFQIAERNREAVRTLKIRPQLISTHQAEHRSRDFRSRREYEIIRTLKVRLQLISMHQAVHRGRDFRSRRECEIIRTLKVRLQFISMHQALHRSRDFRSRREYGIIRTLKDRLQFISNNQTEHRGCEPVRLMTDSDRGGNADMSES
jgi:hypothetical protein